MKAYVQKYGQEIFNTLSGGVVGWVSQGFFKEWIQPVILTVLCAVLSLLIGHFGKKILNSWEYNRKLPRFKKNGKDENRD